MFVDRTRYCWFTFDSFFDLCAQILSITVVVAERRLKYASLVRPRLMLIIERVLAQFLINASRFVGIGEGSGGSKVRGVNVGSVVQGTRALVLASGDRRLVRSGYGQANRLTRNERSSVP